MASSVLQIEKPPTHDFSKRLQDLCRAFTDQQYFENELDNIVYTGTTYPNVPWDELQLDRHDKSSMLIEISNTLTQMRHPVGRHFCCAVMIHSMGKESLTEWIETTVKRLATDILTINDDFPVRLWSEDADFSDWFRQHFQASTRF